MSEWKDCDDHLRLDGSGNGCSCPFIACTGAMECTTQDGFFCQFLRNKVDVNNLSKKDCVCKNKIKLQE